MSKNSGFLAFFTGGLIGATVALLYAPRSGEETRQLLVQNSQEIKDKAMKSIQEVQDSALVAIEEAQARIEALNKETRERFFKFQDIGQTTLDEQRQSLEKGLQEAKETLATETSSSQSLN